MSRQHHRHECQCDGCVATPGKFRLQNRYQDGGWEWLEGQEYETEDAAVGHAIACACNGIAYGMVRVISPDGLEVVCYAAGSGADIKSGKLPRYPAKPRPLNFYDLDKRYEGVKTPTLMGLPVVIAYPFNFQALVAKEIAKARAQHGPVRGLHEGFAVLLEEVDEFWDEVKKKTPDKKNTFLELIQIAAMAQKIAEDVLGCE